jgi:phenylacetic acid degradation operon negative regulatory protein
VPDGLLPPVAPLTARSVVLNALLGVRPPALPVRSLVRIGTLFGVAERTTRVALTRMVADGDLAADHGVYRLTQRLTRRRARLDEVRWPTTTEWDGSWAMAVVTATARPQSDRVALRKVMVEGRMAELREGVWMRPANVTRSLADDETASDQCRFFTTGPDDDPLRLAATLWDLPTWAHEARRLADRLDDTGLTLAQRFVLASETLRHLVVDPLLPAALQPADWPADDLRSRYVAFEAEVAEEVRRFGESGATAGGVSTRAG